MVHKNMMFGRAAFLTLPFESALSSFLLLLLLHLMKRFEVGQFDCRVHQNFVV